MIFVRKILISNTVALISNNSILKCTAKRTAEKLCHSVDALSISGIAQPHESLTLPTRHLGTSTILLTFRLVVPGATKSKEVIKKQASSSKSSISLPNEAHSKTKIDTPSIHSLDFIKSNVSNLKVVSSSVSSKNAQNETQAQTGIDKSSLQSSVKKSNT